MRDGVLAIDCKSSKRCCRPRCVADACMGLVDDDQRRACAREALTPPVALDVVEADDREGIGVEKGLRDREAAFQIGEPMPR